MWDIVYPKFRNRICIVRLTDLNFVYCDLTEMLVPVDWLLGQ